MKRILILAVLLAGCGPRGENPTNVVAVQGTLLAADGKPAPYVALEFVPAMPGMAAAYAQTDAEGRFKPTTLNNQPGMVPGPYKVVAKSMKKPTSPAVPVALTDETTTNLEVTVAAGELSVQLK